MFRRRPIPAIVSECLRCVLLAAALFLGVIPAKGWAMPALPLRCNAPAWLKSSIQGSMSAVWRELQGSRLSRQAAVEALALVGSRLFPGFKVSLVNQKFVSMEPPYRWNWRLSLQMPEGSARLPEPCSTWMKNDIERALPSLREIVENVPPEALRWSAESFQSQIDKIIDEYIPGWRCSVRVHAEDLNALLDLKLYLRPPLLLAFSPETLSASLPQVLTDRMSDKTLEYLSPLTGLPLSWIRFHLAEMERWLGEKQLQNKWLRMLRASSVNDIAVKPITKVTTRIESTTYSFRGWFSVHAGGPARLEAGLRLGRYFPLGPKIPAEAYAEIVMGLEHWHVDGRAGLRFSPWEFMWLGLEGSTEDSSPLWYRVWLGRNRPGLYGWLRYSDDDDLEAAIGYRLNRYVAFELYYDNRQDDRISLRAFSNL